MPLVETYANLLSFYLMANIFCPRCKYLAAVLVRKNIRAASNILTEVIVMDWVQRVIPYFLEIVFPALLLASCKTVYFALALVRILGW